MSDKAERRERGTRPARASAARTPAPAVLVTASDEEATHRELVRRMCGQDQAALASLYDATASRVHGVIQRIVRRPEVAEEVLADVFHQAWREAARYDAARGKVIAWLLIMGRTRALDALRRADEAFSHPDPHELAGPASALPELGGQAADDPANLLAAVEGNARVHAAMTSLSAIQRQLVALAFFKGLSHAEIAAHTRLPLGSVKTHIRKALAHLRDALASGAPHH
ncbi:MAG: sigma-70 family RNA polymerase sigma factor [Betaproteobacteria bacterium]|nr:sigma-70 family RNA polymerase sigma factor [Betaproteobacteria bacterium]